MIAGFLASATSEPSALLIEGESGIGKTTLWLEALELAEQKGFRVLSARAAEAESVLAYTALADLLDGVPASAWADLHEPQRSAVDQVLMRADEYSVLATSNLNGDYLSDACAAQVGGLGMAPGSNIGDGYGVFEATHGTAPKYADKDVINPSSVMLSGAMMLEFLGWKEAAQLIEDGIARTIQQKKVTYDLERLMPGATKVGTSAFATAIIENMKGMAVGK